MIKVPNCSQESFLFTQYQNLMCKKFQNGQSCLIMSCSFPAVLGERQEIFFNLRSTCPADFKMATLRNIFSKTNK